MELNFQSTSVSWLRSVLREVRKQEEVSEAIVPDTFPDIGSILDSHAFAVLRGKDIRTGSIAISGGIKGGILYLPEDGSFPRCLDYYIPFSVKLENPSFTEHSRVLCDICISEVEGKMIHSRKALLRVKLSCVVTVFEPTEHMIYNLPHKPDVLRVKEADYCFELPLETAERSFFISDSLDMPEGNRAMEQLYKLRCRLELTDRKLVGSRAVFRGNARCKLLYLSQEHNLCTHDFQLPFSQFCELNQDYDEDEQVIFVPMITGYDFEREGQDQAEKAYINIHVLMQCVVLGKRRMNLIEDAFVTAGRFTPQWDEFSVDAILDRPQTVVTAYQQIPGELGQVIDTEVYGDFPLCDRSSDSAMVREKLSAHVLGIGSDGIPACLLGMGEASWEVPLHADADCAARNEMIGSSYVSAGVKSTELRTDLSIQGLCTSKHPVRCLCGGDWEKPNERVPNPLIILRRAAGGTSLWDIAKADGANEEVLRLANGFDHDVVPADQVLLIPIG